MNIQKTFISLMNPITIKAILTIGSPESRIFLYNIIKKITSYDVSSYSIGTQNNAYIYDILSSEEDIILISPNQDVIINLEFNRVYSEITLEKNRKYIRRLDKKYNPSVECSTKIIQINFHSYNHINSKGNLVLKSIKKIPNHNITIYNLYLHDLKFITQLYDNDLYKDLALFNTKSYKELYYLSKNNQRRRNVMKELISLSEAKPFMDLYNHEEYLESLKADFCKKGYEEGIRHQKEIIIKKMFDNKENLDKISNYSGYTKDELLEKIIDNTLNIVNN